MSANFPSNQNLFEAVERVTGVSPLDDELTEIIRAYEKDLNLIDLSEEANEIFQAEREGRMVLCKAIRSGTEDNVRGFIIFFKE